MVPHNLKKKKYNLKIRANSVKQLLLPKAQDKQYCFSVCASRAVPDSWWKMCQQKPCEVEIPHQNLLHLLSVYLVKSKLQPFTPLIQVWTFSVKFKVSCLVDGGSTEMSAFWTTVMEKRLSGFKKRLENCKAHTFGGSQYILAYDKTLTQWGKVLSTFFQVFQTFDLRIYPPPIPNNTY